MTDIANLSRNLRRLRREREVSQRALGESIGTPQSYISALEHGLRPWKDEHIEQLAHALDVTRAVLLKPCR